MRLATQHCTPAAHLRLVRPLNSVRRLSSWLFVLGYFVLVTIAMSWLRRLAGAWP